KPLLGSLAADVPGDGLMLVSAPAGERHAAAEHGRKLDATDGEGRARGIRLGALHRLRLHVGRGDDLVDDAELQRLCRRDRSAAQHQVQRFLLAYQTGQPLRASGARQQPKRHLREADPVLAVCRDAKVAGERDLETAAKAVPIDRRDDNLRRALELAHDLVGVDHKEVLLLRIALREPGDIGARGEELLRRTSQENCLRLDVPARCVDGRAELVEKALVVGVRRRSIKPDDSDRVLPRVRNSHRCAPLEFQPQRRWSMAKMIIAGERVGAKWGKTIEVKDPATGEVVDTVPRADASDVDAAVEAAARAFPAWAATGGLKRAAIMQKAAELIRQHIDEIATLLTRE